MVDISHASPIFGIPLYSKDSDDHSICHMVCEIPKGTIEKMEVNFEETLHPIVQDTTDEGKLRVYKHSPMPWNYGMLPQTYEDPDVVCEYSGKNGDGDPLDVIDIGASTLCIGEVVKVKILGVLPLIDQDEIDWKVIGINVKDELAERLDGKFFLLFGF